MRKMNTGKLEGWFHDTPAEPKHDRKILLLRQEDTQNVIGRQEDIVDVAVDTHARRQVLVMRCRNSMER